MVKCNELFYYKYYHYRLWILYNLFLVKYYFLVLKNTIVKITLIFFTIEFLMFTYFIGILYTQIIIFLVPNNY